MHPGIRPNPHRLLSEERETRVRAVMNSVAEGIVTLDQHGTIESINPANPKEVVGRRLRDFCRPRAITTCWWPTRTSRR